MDWKLIITELQALGWTQAKIAEAMGGKPQSWVADIARGRYKDLKWGDGERLRKMHRREMLRAAKTSASSDAEPAHA